MLTSEAKRRIDGARQVLVGVLPNPMQQVEQITIALIYKFMDDMDEEARKLPNGKGSFFVGELKDYSWHNLMDTRLTNQDKLNKYQEATKKISESEKIPELFRSIFRNTYLPFNDPRILGLFLSEINQFDYSNSEELGNAYEYLLSIMGSQGDAGQFRTPRHIIDFIVKAIDPKKDDRILDPACGTAGFLISAYKHILEAHDGIDNKTGKHTSKETPLTATERAKIHKNITGYDIDSNMVKTAKVNTYLHKFKDPNIKIYDTISKTDLWDEEFDIILANPPFMTPKGGIEPHSKFRSKAKRAEVLFVDYILEHLSLKGRAGIIVPEGVIFQSANAYKALRKDLVEDGLYAVVSLPSGVFNPYSGVKTSVLLFDKDITKKNKEILFLKISQDGYDLGAQRRETPDKNDLPLVVAILKEWKEKQKVKENQIIAFAIKKLEIAKSGDYNLTRDIYKEVVDYANVKWEMVELGNVLDLNFGERITKKNNLGIKYPVYGGGGESFRTDSYNRENEFVISRFAMAENCVRFVNGKFWMMDSGGTFSIKEEYTGELNKDFVGKILLKIQDQIYSCARGNAQKNLNVEQFRQIKIPLPPLEIQKQIAEELDGYQKVIDGAKQVVKNWKPNIKIDPEWEMVELGEVCDVKSGGTPKRNIPEYWGGDIPWVGSTVCKDVEVYDSKEFITEMGIENSSAKLFQIDTVLIALVGATIGKTALLKFESATNQNIAGLYPKNIEILNSIFLYYSCQNLYKEFTVLGDFKMANLAFVKIRKISLPSLEIQERIVSEIKAEQKIIEQNKKLIEIFEQKIKTKISEVWGK